MLSTLLHFVTPTGTAVLAPIALPFFKEKNWSEVPGQAFGAIVFAGAVTSGIGLSLNGYATHGLFITEHCIVKPTKVEYVY